MINLFTFMIKFIFRLILVKNNSYLDHLFIFMSWNGQNIVPKLFIFYSCYNTIPDRIIFFSIPLHYNHDHQQETEI